MSIEMNDFQLLAAQVSRGDPDARTELRQKLEPHMARLVRRAMRLRTDTSPLARRIYATAHATATNHPTTTVGGREGLVSQVARSMCESLLGRLQPGTALVPEMQDTVLI
jgi:hypothetical protein